MPIHPTAIVHPGARIGENVEIGPYSIIAEDVVIGDNCMIDSHVKVARYTTVGAGTRIYLGALVGEEPQDHRFRPGVVSSTEIGENCVIREYVTIHRSPFENAKTTVGDHTLLMSFVHVGHDAQIGSHVTVANHTAVSGHVVIEDYAVLSGYILIHQFCRIGALAMVGGGAVVIQDIPPYCMMTEKGFICGGNIVGLRRAGIESDARNQIRHAIKSYFFHGLNAGNALAEIESENPGQEVRHFVEFIRGSTRGIAPGEPGMIKLGRSSE